MSVKPIKLVRITTVPMSLQLLLTGQMKYMQHQGMEVTMISSKGKQVEALKAQEGCSFHAIPFTRTLSPLQDLWCLLLLWWYFVRTRPHIVHSHTPKAGLISMLAAKLAFVPVRLHTVAGLPWMEATGFKRKLFQQMEHLTAWAANGVYPNSFALLQFMQQHQIGQGKLKVMGNGTSNGIDTSFFVDTESLQTQGNQLRNRCQLSSNDWVWIFIGRIVRDKGIEELVSAFIQMQQQFPNDQLWLLGEAEDQLDPLTASTKHQIQHHPNIISWGFITDIRPYLSAAQVLCFPSYREGFPNVPLQAAAMQKMLILSNINGCNELVTHLHNGLLVAPKNQQQLYESMLYVRKHPNDALQMAKNARKTVERKYSRMHLWDLWYKEYVDWMKKKL